MPVAGEGTRMASLARGRPKPLLEVGGRPLLHILLDRIPRDVEDVCLVVPAGDDRIRREMGGAHDGRTLHYAEQPRPAGVGDAVLRAAGVVRGAFLVVMGDSYFDEDLGPCVREWRASGAAGAVLVEPLRGAPADPIGLVVVEEGRVRRIWKGSVREGAADARIAGAAILPGGGLPGPEEMSATGTGEVELEDIVRRLLDGGDEFVAVRYRGWRRNVNQPEDLEAVERRILARRKDRRGRGVHVPGGSGRRGA